MEQVKREVDEFMKGLDEFVYETRKEIDEQSYFKAGLEQGRSEGLEQGRSEIAKNLFAEGFDINLIAKITGLSLEELNTLKGT